MPSAFLTGIRNLRSSLLSGVLLLASIYILALGNESPAVALRPTAQYLVNLHTSVPVLLMAVSAYIVGSLYITALEGLVDLIHRKLVYVNVTEQDSRMRRAFLSISSPLSDTARRRLRLEAMRFFREATASPDEETDKGLSDAFVQRVFADVLWMEGKLTGTPLRDTYSEYRAEGEFRLGIGLLLPLAAAASAYAIQLGSIWLTLIVVVASIVAVQTCNYGLYYYRRAHSLLAHHVSDGTLLTPSMETLKRATDVGNINQK